MNFVGRTGERTIDAWQRHRHTAAVAFTALCMALSPRQWTRDVRAVLARQILFTGFDAVTLVASVAVLMGLAIVLQAEVQLRRLGQSALVGPILVAVIIRELGPLLVNFIVIGRSGTAISSELSTMRVSGEIRVLDAQGLDPMVYLVVPRCVGVAVSVFCLTIVFILVSLVSGYVSGLALGADIGLPSVFAGSVAKAVAPADFFNLLAKTLLPGLLTGAICCIGGLSVRGALTEVPQAATRGVVRSVVALFFVSVLVSLVTYL